MYIAHYMDILYIVSQFIMTYQFVLLLMLWVSVMQVLLLFVDRKLGHEKRKIVWILSNLRKIQLTKRHITCLSHLERFTCTEGPRNFIFIEASLNTWGWRSMDKVTSPLGKINLMQHTHFFTFHECKKVAWWIDLTRFLADTDVSRML